MEQNGNMGELDWSEGQAMTGCSDRQVRFVQLLLQGATKTAAYREAGYGGEGSALRSAASQAAKSHKVKALLAWAKAGGAGISEVRGDMDELWKILWRHARSADAHRSVQASALIHKLEAQERENAAYQSHDPHETLTEIFKISPVGALLLARQHGFDWKPSVPAAGLTEDVVMSEFDRLQGGLADLLQLVKECGQAAPEAASVEAQA